MSKFERIFDRVLIFAIGAGCAAALLLCGTVKFWDGYFEGYETAKEDVQTVQTAEQQEVLPVQMSAREILPEIVYIKAEQPTETEAQTPVQEEPEAPEETALQLTEQEIEWLAITIYKEAGGDAVCDECRMRVGDVVLNRVADARFPDTMEGVLLQKGQYNTFYWDGICWPERAYTEAEAHAVERARDIARRIAQGEHSDVYGQGYIGQAEFTQGYDWFWCDGICFSKW